MQQLTVAGFVFVLLTAAGQAQDVPEFPKPQKEHEWLQQCVGEWDAETEMLIPGQEPLKVKGTESVRSIGGFWILCENNSEFAGRPVIGLMTLGYDADDEKYVGTWVDSMTGYLWKYDGSLDSAGKVLTLETEGPCPERPGELSNFREVLELKSKDHKVFTSSMQNEDGTWQKMLTISYRRKAAGPNPARPGVEARPDAQ